MADTSTATQWWNVLTGLRDLGYTWWDLQNMDRRDVAMLMVAEKSRG